MAVHSNGGVMGACRFENGENCPSGGPSSTVIDFICDKSPAGQGKGKLRRVSSPDDSSLGQPCTYKFEWSTVAACASDTKVGGDWVETGGDW